jgi:hypothetical protein
VHNQAYRKSNNFIKKDLKTTTLFKSMDLEASTVPSSPASSQIKTYWLISELAAGWFEHSVQKAPKFWWMGPFREWFTCAWEFSKVVYPLLLLFWILYNNFRPVLNQSEWNWLMRNIARDAVNV